MAGKGGGGGPTEAGFLDLPTYTLAALLVFFLVLSTAFERGAHALIYYLKKRKRNGLAQAVSNLVMELTLVGFVSLLLIVLQGPISNICVDYSPGSYNYWSLLSNVDGCDCCLAHTAQVSSCFQAARQCGPSYCNCDAQEPACLASQQTLASLLEEWSADSTCNTDAAAAACTQAYLQQVVANPQAESAVRATTPECEETITLNADKCGPGKGPLITVTAMHELHIFIFVVAISHVVMGVLMVLLSSWQLHMWKKACADEDDEFAQSVRQQLQAQAEAWARPPSRSRAAVLNLISSWRRSAGPSGRSRSSKLPSPAASPRTPASPTTAASPTAAGGDLPRDALSIQVVTVPAPPAGAAEVAAREADGGSTSSGKASSNWGAPHAASSSQGAKLQAAGSSGGTEDRALEAATAAAGAAGAAEAEAEAEAAAYLVAAAGQPATAGSADQPLAGPHRPSWLPAESSHHRPQDRDGPNLLTPVASLELEGKVLPDVVTAGEGMQRQGSWRAGVNMLGRSSTLKEGDHRAWVTEYAACLLHLLNPRPVAGDDIRMMRASFMLTHRVPAGFDFWRYVSDSMEDDFAHICGISLEMWVTMVVFVLISGPLGWATTLFLALAALVLVVVNLKLFRVIRHVCRGCRVNQLSSNVFWFEKPSLMLHPIKYTLFLCAFIMGAALFFLWSFGASSCPFTAREQRFYFALVVPWWSLLLFALLVFLDASFRTLPVYSLAVQMGSDFKHHMLPRGIREKLLLAAQRIKRKHKEQQRAKAAGATFATATASAPTQQQAVAGEMAPADATPAPLQQEQQRQEGSQRGGAFFSTVMAAMKSSSGNEGQAT